MPRGIPFLVSGSAMLLAAAALSAQDCRTTILYNGHISSIDAKGTTATSITIEGDRIAALGVGSGLPKHSGCARLIDLNGRRVVPGLIDSHNHIVVVSARPGFDVRLDLAASVSEVQHQLHERAAALPAGSWITGAGGWGPEQLAEKRMPTLAELDAAVADDPIYLQTGFDGPAVTNSKGKAFFASKGIEVSADGGIAANNPTIAAFSVLKALQTPEDRKRGAFDVMQYAASYGLTTSDDKGGNWPTDMEGTSGVAETIDGTHSLNPYTDYDGFLALDREGRMAMRLRVFFYMQDTRAELPLLHARLENSFHAFGDAWLKVSGIGERIYAGAYPFTANASPDVYLAAARLIAQRGWTYDEHAMALADEKAFTAAWEKVNAEFPLGPLHWCLAHVPGIDDATLARLKALGVGVSAAGGRYTASNPPRIEPKDIPPFRRLVNSGLHVGYGSDGGTVSPLDPWPHLQYMVTGRNSAGQMVAKDQTLTRLQALRLYTAAQPWFTQEEADLGTLEPGKLADLAVLSEDFLDPKAVADDAIKHIRSVLTMVGGKVVYDSGKLRVLVRQ